MRISYYHIITFRWELVKRAKPLHIFWIKNKAVCDRNQPILTYIIIQWEKTADSNCYASSNIKGYQLGSVQDKHAFYKTS